MASLSRCKDPFESLLAVNSDTPFFPSSIIMNKIASEFCWSRLLKVLTSSIVEARLNTVFKHVHLLVLLSLNIEHICNIL